jgi:tRNA(Ile)-lysidine synthase
MGGELRLPPAPLGPRGRLWVGYSGGCDSTALLQRLHEDGASPRAVHVHHGLQPAADDWVRHCRRFCRARGIPLRVLRVRPEPGHRQGPEAAARVARYAALVPLLRSGDVLALAHHRDDQAETVLMRALRGSGIPGLAAMRTSEPLGRGVLWRPLLAVPRERLRSWALARGLDWITDPHNDDPRYTRAFLRRELMPKIAEHFPSAAAQLAKLAAHARDAQALLEQLAALDAERCASGDGLAVDALLALPAERRRNLVYHRWCALGLLPPPQAWYAELEKSVLRARSGARPLLVCGDGEARRHKGKLLLQRRPPLR